MKSIHLFFVILLFINYSYSQQTRSETKIQTSPTQKFSTNNNVGTNNIPTGTHVKNNYSVPQGQINNNGHFREQARTSARPHLTNDYRNAGNTKITVCEVNTLLFKFKYSKISDEANSPLPEKKTISQNGAMSYISFCVHESGRYFRRAHYRRNPNISDFGEFGIIIAEFNDRTSCKKALNKFRSKYKIYASFVKDVSRTDNSYYLIAGRFVRRASAMKLLYRLWGDFPQARVIKLF